MARRAPAARGDPEFRYRMAAAWLFFTGCRVSEAIRAQQTDVVLRTTNGLYEWQIPKTKTHVPRSVWLPETLSAYIESSRKQNKPKPNWPVLWGCGGRGYGRTENPGFPISDRTINSALNRARDAASLTVHVTAHVAKHSYCTNWIRQEGSGELAMQKLSRQVGTSAEVLRRTYVHVQFSDEDWAAVRSFGSKAA